MEVVGAVDTAGVVLEVVEASGVNEEAGAVNVVDKVAIVGVIKVFEFVTGASKNGTLDVTAPPEPPPEPPFPLSGVVPSHVNVGDVQTPLQVPYEPVNVLVPPSFELKAHTQVPRPAPSRLSQNWDGTIATQVNVEGAVLTQLSEPPSGFRSRHAEL